jgi:hypothetical protein
MPVLNGNTPRLNNVLAAVRRHGNDRGQAYRSGYIRVLTPTSSNGISAQSTSWPLAGWRGSQSCGFSAFVLVPRNPTTRMSGVSVFVQTEE